MSTPKLGTLEQMDPRDIWKHEAHDFTPWLLANADILGDALGMDLQLHEAEHSVGSFWLDLHGTADGETVIVENQLAPTDHTHLGQILTYAGGTDPRTIVWIATTFREEHRAALDWLNRNSSDDVRFFGVEVGVVRIGDSMPAPRFTVVAKPNDWGKSVKTATTGDGVGLTYAAFWEKWLDLVQRERGTWTKSRVAPKQSWMTLPAGSSEIWYVVAFTQQGVRSEIYFGASDAVLNRERFERLLSFREPFEQAYGSGLHFDGLDGKVSCRIYDVMPGTVQETERWEDYLQFFLSSQTHLRSALAAVGGLQAVVA